MTEEGHGLEKYISQFARHFGKRNEKDKHKEQGFTAEQAIEKFRLLSAAGPEGQEPIVSFQEGNTIDLADQKRFPPGTILRETFYPDPDRDPVFVVREEIDGELVSEDIDHGPPGPLYFWYCLGSFSKEKRS